MRYFCMLRIIVFQAKENRRGGCYYKRERAAAKEPRSPLQRARAGRRNPQPAGSQGHRWSRKQPQSSAARGQGGCASLDGGLSPTLPTWGVFVPSARPGHRAAACTGVQWVHTHAPPCTRSELCSADVAMLVHLPGAVGSSGGAASTQHGSPPGLLLPVLLSLIPASPAAAPTGFYGNSAGKHGFQ